MNILRDKPSEEYSNHITEYYTKNNYANIGKLLNSWRTIEGINSERMVIFENCYKAMQTVENKRIINDIIIPTLTAQITGLSEDLHKLVPGDIHDSIKKELASNSKIPSEGEITIEYLWKQEQTREVLDCYTVISEAVMKNTRKIETFKKEDLEKYTSFNLLTHIE